MSIDRFRPHSIPAHTHPLVRRLLEEMNAQQCTYQTMNERTGLHQDTIRRWRDKSLPRIDDLDACFSVLGKKLVVGSLAGWKHRQNRKNEEETDE